MGYSTCPGGLQPVLAFDLGLCAEKGMEVSDEDQWASETLNPMCVQHEATTGWPPPADHPLLCTYTVVLLSVTPAFIQNSNWLSILKHPKAKRKDKGQIRDN